MLIMKADFPLSFINGEIQKGKYDGDENFIIPTDLFRITKPFISIEIPY